MIVKVDLNLILTYKDTIVVEVPDDWTNEQIEERIYQEMDHAFAIEEYAEPIERTGTPVIVGPASPDDCCVYANYSLD